MILLEEIMPDEDFDDCININENEFYEPIPDELEDVEDDVYQVSMKGIEKLIEWTRFQVQLFEAQGGKLEDEDFSEIPFLVGFLIPEVCYYRGVPVPGMNSDGELD
jgi:hypothetical protein